MDRDSNGKAALRQAHAVVKQRTRLIYAPPQLTALPAGAPDRRNPASAAHAVTLRAARAERGLSIQQLANRSGISPATIYRIESGRTRPRPHVIFALSEDLGVSPHDIAEFRDRIAPGPLVTRR